MSDTMREKVQRHYGEAAREAAAAADTAPAASCCAGTPSCCGTPQAVDPVSRDLYESDELQGLPPAAVAASLGCGNPTALAELSPGEVVLDLGSGGGIDVLLSARRVGPTGKAYGVDMTDEMLDLARANQRRAGVENAEFLRGTIEDVPLPDQSVDVVISNCVINLSTDKDAVLREAFRVLRPGGRFAVSDVVFQGDLALVPNEVLESAEAWAGCIAGALVDDDYRRRLAAAGFVDVAIEVTRVYDELAQKCADVVLPDGVRLVSAFVRGRRPH
jgi:SAM-dependent methyltransferase